MLFRSLGFTTSFANIAVIAALFHNETIGNFWSPQWMIGMGSILFLSLISTAFFYLNNEKEGLNVLNIYGGIYAAIALLIYGYWGVKNIFYNPSMEEFSGFFMIFTTMGCISFLSLRNYMKESNNKILLTLSSLLSLFTVGITFATIYKYIFQQAAFNFDDLVLELFVIILGSVLFISTYSFAKKNS